MIGNYRKHYNPIYRLWEVQRKQGSSIIEGVVIWITITCLETESEADAEIERLSA